MSSANDEEPIPNASEKGATVAEPAAGEETTSELELIDATPTPMVLPIPAAAPPPAPLPPGKRPPPLPPRTTPPPPPVRATPPRPPVPPPPPGANLEDVGTPAPSGPPPAAAATAMRPTGGLPASVVARLSPTPDAPVPPARPSQARPVVTPRVPPPADAAAGPPPASPLAAPARSPSRPSSAVPAVAEPFPALVLGAGTVPLPAVASHAPRPAEPERFSPDLAVADARKRVEQSPTAERNALARARLELGVLLEVAAGDAAAALAEYRAAHGVAAHLLAPVASARRLTPLRPAAPAVALLEAEIHATSDPAARLRRQLELGMLLGSSGAPAERTGQAFREVLGARPGHPGALRGLETALRPSPRLPESGQQMEALATHLETMGAAFRSDTRLAAWIEVERGQLLEKLGRADAACAAFEAALALDGRIGPVRDAYTRHLFLQGQIESLVKAWSAEAALETDPARAARLLYFAGRLAAERLDQKPQAVELFERAAQSGPAAPSTRRAALRELVRLYEALGALDRAAAAANQVLGLARDAERPYWHRRLIPLCEGLGRFADLAAHAHQVLAVEPDDEAVRDKLDRALAALGQHDERVAMLTEQAAHASTPNARIALLQRAAAIAEHEMRRPDLALFSLRSAWAVDPGNADVTDEIVRLLLPGSPPAVTDPDDPARVRARIDFYVEAAATASDPSRKIAYLEKLALIWEDEVRAPDRALGVHAEILAVEPRRRSAILGLSRCAARAGNAKELFRALVLEADQAGDDPPLERSLLLRAAEVASQQLGEPDAALDLVKRVLSKTGGDPAALRAAFRIHERAGRQAEALAQLRLLLGQDKKEGNYPVQAEIARFLEERMHRTADALTAWREAHRMDPGNPTARTEIRRILLANGDHRAVAEELAALGGTTGQPAERGELLLEAAEIYDDRLGDAERAIPLLEEAHKCLPDDPAIVERLDRAYLRSGKRSERLALLYATESPHPESQLAIASLQAEERDSSKACKRLAELTASETTATPALRILEHAARRAERWSDLATILRRQIECFATNEARLGSVYELMALEEYGETHPPDGQPSARELLAKLAPQDLLPAELLLKRGGLSLAGPTPPRIVAATLGAVAAATSDPLAAAAQQVAAALLIENGDEPSFQSHKEALLAYAMALESWPDCVTAARGARRMALRLGEMPTFVKAAAALGSLEMDPATRCERLLEAADGSRGGPEETAAAFELRCKALVEDPNSVRAADAVIAAVAEGRDAGQAGEALRAALERALAPDHAAKLGAALAHVALAKLNDHTMALEALRRVRKRAPKHVGNLLALADISNVLGLHSEAVEAASSALGLAREPAERLHATIALAEVHVRAPAFRDTARREAGDAERLAEAADGDGELMGRLGAVYRLLGDETSAERVLLQALALGGQHAGALDHLLSMYGGSREAGERIATTLRGVMAQAQAAGQPMRPEWLAALGKVQATMLGHSAEGLARLREAAILGPGRVATYQALAEAHGSAHDEAARDITAMATAFFRSGPNAAQSTSFLGLVARVCRQGQRQAIAETADELLAFLGGGAVAGPSGKAATGLVPGSLRRETLVASLLHDPAQAAFLDVAALLAEPVGKLVRPDPESLGLAPRDRLTARASHPVRALADRIARAFDDLRFDLYVDAASAGRGRLLPGEPAALVLPPGFGAEPEAEQAATLARLLAYLALDIPWLEELALGDTDGILFGGLRAGSDLWGQGELSPGAEVSAGIWRRRLSKVGRRTKRTLEETAQRLRAPADSQAWRDAMSIVGWRAAFVVTGRIGTVLGQALRLDGELGGPEGAATTAKLFEKPLYRELMGFALSDTALSLRRTAGTI